MGGKIRVEEPVSLNGARFFGDCSVGYLSYVGPGSTAVSTDIGRYCAIAPHVEIGPAEHPTDWLSVHPFQYNGTKQFHGRSEYERIAGNLQFSKNQARTVIGNDVWIGDGVFIRKGCRIADGAVIGARSVVIQDIPPYAIVVGDGRITRYRFPDHVIEDLLDLRWWELDLSHLRQKVDFTDVPQAIKMIREADLPTLQVTAIVR